MDVGAALRHATEQLAACGILTARLDTLVLFEDVLERDRASILAHTDDTLTPIQTETLRKLIARRCTHEPLAYIRGKADFYSHTFVVDRNVLVPRPETEAMIDLFKSLPVAPGWKIADIGTGSGAIGLIAALESTVKLQAVDLYDISPAALEIAQKNARQLGVAAVCRVSDLLSDIKADYTVLLANLPYVPNDFPINTAAGYEPRIALFAGDDGLDDYRTFWGQVRALNSKPQYILCESFPDQHPQLEQMAKVAGYLLRQTSGFIQLFELS